MGERARGATEVLGKPHPQRAGVSRLVIVTWGQGVGEGPVASQDQLEGWGSQ